MLAAQHVPPLLHSNYNKRNHKRTEDKRERADSHDGGDGEHTDRWRHHHIAAWAREISQPSHGEHCVSSRRDAG
jgi:hypothetical protein